MGNDHTPADTLRARYSSIIHICDSEAFLTPVQKQAITAAFLDTAWDYALAAGPGIWPPEWPTR